MISTIETITPELAEKYLQCSAGNRALRGKTISALVRDIKNGDFILTHQGIAFNERGELIDGHHRLTAVALAGMPVQMMVTRAAPNESVMAIDRGTVRTIQDQFKFTHEYEDCQAMRNHSTTAAIRKLCILGFNQNISLTDTEIRKLFDRFKPQIEALYKCSITRRPAGAAVNAAALAALICGEPEADLYDFFTIYLKGTADNCTGNIAAAYNWARQVADAKMKHSPFTASKLYMGTQNAIYNYIHSGRTSIVRATKYSRYQVSKEIGMVLNEPATDA